MLIRNDVAVQIQDSDLLYQEAPEKNPGWTAKGYQYSYPIYMRSLITDSVTDPNFFQKFSQPCPPTGNTADNNLIGTGACSFTAKPQYRLLRC